MKKQRRTQLNILGVRVDFLTMEEALYWVEEQVKYNKVGQITTPNPEQVVLAQEDKEFKEVLNKADLNICDGIGLLWAAKAAQSPKPKTQNQKPKLKDVKTEKAIKRLSGADLMLEMCELAVRKGLRVMLVGGKEGVAKETAKILEKKLCDCEDPAQPEIKQFLNKNKKRDCFAGACNGSKHCFKVIGIEGSKNIENETKKEKEEIIKKINKFKPNLLFVAYGAPWQEKWIAENLSKLKVNAAMGIGGAFDYISGKVSRAPRFVRKIGLEWLWRLAREPWRVKRQLNLLKFIWLVKTN